MHIKWPRSPFIHHPHSPSAGERGRISLFRRRADSFSTDWRFNDLSAFVLHYNPPPQDVPEVEIGLSGGQLPALRRQICGPWAALSSPSCRGELHWWHTGPLARRLIVMVGYVPWPAVSPLSSFGIPVGMPSGPHYLLASHLPGRFNISCARCWAELAPLTCLLHQAWKYPNIFGGEEWIHWVSLLWSCCP